MSASKTKLKTLDSIQNISLRIITGAMKTSPIKSLECEAGIPPLELRRKELTAKIWFKPELQRATSPLNEIKELAKIAPTRHSLQSSFHSCLYIVYCKW